VTTRGAWTRAGLVAAAVVIADQVTKQLVRDGLQLTQQRDVIGGVVKLQREANTGIAFSALSGAGWILGLFVIVAIVALLVYFARHATRPWAWLAVGLLVGGAIGNAVDRIAHGAVTDFVKLPHWPAFNVADVAITFGVITLVFVLERGGGATDG
jgi:signal peptidase II